MLNVIIPVIFFCTVPTDKAPVKVCNGFVSIDHTELDPVKTPMQCLLDGTEYASKYIIEHPKDKLEYRIVCKFAEKI